jgi:hypothetical protein
LEEVKDNKEEPPVQNERKSRRQSVSSEKEDL